MRAAVLLASLLVLSLTVPAPPVAAHASADAPLSRDAHADPEQRITNRLRRVTLEEGLPAQRRQQGSVTTLYWPAMGHIQSRIASSPLFDQRVS
jgi:hypothetical protein